MVQMRAALERSCENVQSNEQMPLALLDLHAVQPALLLDCAIYHVTREAWVCGEPCWLRAFLLYA